MKKLLYKNRNSALSRAAPRSRYTSTPPPAAGRTARGPEQLRPRARGGLVDDDRGDPLIGDVASKLGRVVGRQPARQEHVPRRIAGEGRRVRVARRTIRQVDPKAPARPGPPARPRTTVRPARTRRAPCAPRAAARPADSSSTQPTTTQAARAPQPPPASATPPAPASTPTARPQSAARPTSPGRLRAGPPRIARPVRRLLVGAQPVALKPTAQLIELIQPLRGR